jgi:RNA polymerase sigma-70 factor, ECF subfamily
LTQETDQILVERYLRGRDEKSFRELYRRHTSALYGLALRLCESEADAQDAIQETWIRSCAALSEFQWKSSLRTWLSGILINCSRELTRRRDRRREEQLPDDDAVIIATTPSEKITLDQAIARLPNGYREVLILHDVEGYTHEEIGSLLDISVGTSKSQLHHARRAIRAMFNTEQSA